MGIGVLACKVRIHFPECLVTLLLGSVVPQLPGSPLVGPYRVMKTNLLFLSGPNTQLTEDGVLKGTAVSTRASVWYLDPR